MVKPTTSGTPLTSLDIQAGYSYAPRVLSLWNRSVSIYLPFEVYIGYEWINYRGNFPSSLLSISGISSEKLLWGLSVGISEEIYIAKHLAVIMDSSIGYDFESQIRNIRPTLSIGLRRSL